MEYVARTDGAVQVIFIVNRLFDLWIMNLMGLEVETPNQFGINLVHFGELSNDADKINPQDREAVETSKESAESKEVEIALLGRGYELDVINRARPNPQNPISDEDSKHVNQNSRKLKELHDGASEVSLPTIAIGGTRVETFKEATDRQKLDP
ncbi:MAG: hypothetical protein LBJ77_01525 [Holosporales bacterium]|jgi:hypothetical protein|nr:hypothetical protein [Holosporales bacterium]